MTSFPQNFGASRGLAENANLLSSLFAHCPAAGQGCVGSCLASHLMLHSLKGMRITRMHDGGRILKHGKAA